MDFKCKCENIKTQSYENQVSILMPFWDKFTTPTWKKWTWVCIDTCLVQEIAELWKKWIRTTWSCCGHNINNPFIWVIPEDIQKMKELWYIVQENPLRPWDEDSFYPKSLNSINITLNVINTKEISKILALTYETASWYTEEVMKWKEKSEATYLKMLNIKYMIEEIYKNVTKF